MKTTININGLDVEFTDEVPTRAGAYWFRLTGAKPQLVEVCEGGYGTLYVPGEGSLDEFHGLWSAPLVPVTEVERMKEEVERAYVEGYDDAGGSGYNMTLQWKTSNARKVVEGLQ